MTYVDGYVFAVPRDKKEAYTKQANAFGEMAMAKGALKIIEAWQDDVREGKQTDFFKQYREKGIPASQVPSEVVEPLIDQVMGAPEDKILNIGEIATCDLPKPAEAFDSFVCEDCGDMVVEKYGRVVGDRRVCIPCQQKASGETR